MLKDTKTLNGKGIIKTPQVNFNLKSISEKNKATLICAVFRYDNHSQESTFLSYVGARSKQKAMKMNELMNKKG